MKIHVPHTPLKLARRIGLESLRRAKKDGHIHTAGIAEMIACLIYNKPSSFQITKIKLLILAIILLAPDGSGLFMYFFLWLIIPSESDEECESRQKSSKYSFSRRKARQRTNWKEGQVILNNLNNSRFSRSPKLDRMRPNKTKQKWWTEIKK